ncbi:FAD-dependent oxidoreductase [Amycolatopsis antarctica]|uniref:FAD-dependent oxidoreductase n=1 Tax=Amycolatopsis antarctica TaxID=1854586 RepID=A0A263D1A8_9PSEU|nr:FAD-dependent monooxygenase [Amycolatopsis antarctica]OZM71306.1 FAD-dependent oxidoreductase [Amycolatopsis antarctica]
MTHALIAGGGIAGAATALALRKAGISSTIHEAFPAGADDVGAFLTIMHNGMNALSAIDAGTLVAEASFPADSVEILDAGGLRTGLREYENDPGAHLGPRTLRRSELYRVLQDAAVDRGCRVEHGKRVTRAEHRGGAVHVGFDDGSWAEGDLLVGADGIHSTVRTIIDAEAPSPRYTGLNIVYGYARRTTPADITCRYRMGRGARAAFGYIHTPDGETWWFGRLPGSELSREEMAARTAEEWKRYATGFFAEDGTSMADLVRSTAPGDIVVSNAYDVPSTPRWWRDSMVLAGDAAHAASPAAGQGASMALEDSVTLAKCLRDLPTIEVALTAYEGLRRDRVEQLVAASAAHDSPPPERSEVDSGGARETSAAPDTGPARRRWLYGHHIDWHTRIPETPGADDSSPST